MDEYGRLQPAPGRFPSSAGGKGFKPLADYVHSLGLKFGIHIMRGMPRMAAHRHLPILGCGKGCHEVANPNSICTWNPDMYGLRCDMPEARAYYDSIFRMYAEWGVDFVKCDDIAREYPHCKREIEGISDACRACGRDIVLSLSPGPAPLEQAEHLKKYANMWRITDDFWDEWRLLKGMFERAEKWTNFTQAEQRTMMTLWCMMRSPLMMGGELTKNDDFTLKLLTNRDVLAIEKTSACAHPLWTTEDESVWIAPRRDGTGLYVALFNLSEETRTVRVTGEMLEGTYSEASELWTGEKLHLADGVTATLGKHDAAVFWVE